MVMVNILQFIVRDAACARRTHRISGW